MQRAEQMKRLALEAEFERAEQRKRDEQMSKEMALRSGKQLSTCSEQELQVFLFA